MNYSAHVLMIERSSNFAD